ncbi:MAG: phenylalanine--tRNA ligase subunit alpha [Candidatus Parcubacteria bacterium]|nr:phenylalanine--tRNA ligase subunit alpha [Candidatus Parcubacteria bacterium]
MDWEKISSEAKIELLQVTDLLSLEKWRISYLGRKSALALFLRQLKDLPLEEKKIQGPLSNKVRQSWEKMYQEKNDDLKNNQIVSDSWDHTVPVKSALNGHLHPLTLMAEKVVSVFEKMGFEIVEGPEVEDDYHNFEALNVPANHPARDMWDTFWIKSDEKEKNLLLRTHTSPDQIRYMETHQPPFRILVPGRAYRHEATDATHEMQFYQIEGLVVSEDITLANFKNIIEESVRHIFKKDFKIIFRPDYFPFVSPGVEVDISCFKCRGKGCRLCSNTGWIEVMGAGMVHEKVLTNVGYEKGRYQGFAFGLGLERYAMIQYGIDEIRLFESADLRFLKQF